MEIGRVVFGRAKGQHATTGMTTSWTQPVGVSNEYGQGIARG